MEDKRLTRVQKSALIILICLETLTDDCRDDLAGRVENMEAWAEKAGKAKETLHSMVDDIIQTMAPEQLQHFKKTARDYELRLMPRMTPWSANMVVDKETLRTLIDAAQKQCVDCFKTEAESRNCKLQKLLATLIPMERYEDTGLCVFNNKEWEN